MRKAPHAHKDYPINDEEFASRLESLRGVMEAEALDAVITYGAHRDYQPADLRYFARWYCVEEETAALLVPQQGPTVLLTDASWDVERAGAEAYADSVKHAPDLGPALAQSLEHAVGMQGRVGIAGYKFFPAPAYLAMTDGLPDCHFVDASEITGRLRMVKSAAELNLMRQASRISDEGMRAGLDTIADGATEQEVAAAAESAIIAAGAETSFVTEMGAGPRTAYGTFLPGRRRLAEGDIAVLDCGARYYGYHGDMCRTVVVGDPSAAQERMLQAVETAVNESIAAVRPGVTVGAIRDVAAAAIAEAGFGDNWWDAFMPHGNGTGQHEMPNAKEHPDVELQEGMVLCIEPGITLPDEGAVIIEQMIAVTRYGAEVLNKLPTNMWDR
jgi:Xaa-Pro aminopeptidase